MTPISVPGDLPTQLVAAEAAQQALIRSAPHPETAPASAAITAAAAVAEISRVRDKADGRRAISSGHVVVALAGTTGAGKSSLLNRLTGTNHATVGVRRPTTTAPVAISSAPAPELLDWLGIEHRVTVPGLRERFGDVVLVDLPDIDSIRTEHREIAGALTAVADVMVWVVDPEKYADRVLHENYVRPAVEHAAVTRVLINQADRLSAADAEAIRADLHRLLAEAGYPADVAVGVVSARTGEGLADLEADIARLSAARTARDERLRADLRTLGHDLAREVPPLPETAISEAAIDAELARLTREIVASTGIEAYVHASSRRLARSLAAGTGWPVLRPVHRLRRTPPAPALGTAGVGGAGARFAASFAAPPYAHSSYWSGVLQQRALEASDDLERDLDLIAGRTVSGYAPPAEPRRRWTGVLNVAQWVGIAAIMTAAVAYGAQILLRYIGVDLPPALAGVPAAPGYPELPAVSWSAALLVSGLLLGALLSAIAAATRAGAARRHRRRLRDHLGEVTARAVATDVGEPMAAMAAAARAYARAVETLITPAPGRNRGPSGAQVTAPKV